MKNGNYEYKLLYSGQLSPIARLNDEDGVVEEYVYGSRVNVPEYMIKDGRKYRFITDHRGSVRMVVDTHDGTVMQRTDYDEFGLIIDEDLAEGFQPVLFGYAGGLQDRDTGLIRFGARDYDPMVGRWTSKEPLGFNGSSNFYVYAENDPVNYVDVTGLKPYECYKTEADAVKAAGYDVYDRSHRMDATYLSILNNWNGKSVPEFASTIYMTNTDEENVCFFYSEPTTDYDHNRVVPENDDFLIPLSIIHNHPSGNSFSTADKNYAKKHDLNIWVIREGSKQFDLYNKYMESPWYNVWNQNVTGKTWGKRKP